MVLLFKFLQQFYLFFILFFSGLVFSFELDQRKLDQFANELSENYAFDKGKVKEILSLSRGSEKIIKLMSRPAEKAKSWEDYRKIFVTKSRVRQGCRFWLNNKEALERAQNIYGVSPGIITSIIGIETIYGANTGSHRLLDSLPTLAFHYPGENLKREKYFRYQLQEFFLLAREEGLNMKTLEGSYAGAIGIPQFMPNNYRQLAVDFDDDGIKNIKESQADAVGSVANYLKYHGWKSNGLVYLEAKLKPGRQFSSLTNVARPNKVLKDLEFFKINAGGIPRDTPVSVVKFQESLADKYWVVFENFYAVFRYNPRIKYALVVVLLASDLEQRCQVDKLITR